MSYSEDLAKKVLDQYFRGFKYFDNFRPSWLGGLEIDRFYPDLGLAIEFQGGQHFRPVPGMHKDEEAFRRQVTNDSQKRAILFKYGYQLYAIEMIDLDQLKLRGLMQRMVNDAKKYATLKGNMEMVGRLNTVRYDLPLSADLIQQVDRNSIGGRKDYFGQPNKKPSWIIRLLREIFLPKPKRRRY